jgi:hypothetical protein
MVVPQTYWQEQRHRTIIAVAVLVPNNSFKPTAGVGQLIKRPPRAGGGLIFVLGAPKQLHMQDGQFLIGKVVMIALSYFDRAGKHVSNKQHHGVVMSCGAGGIVVELSSGDEFTLPPHQSSFQPAPPGSYFEHSTGESVENPDFLASYNLYDEGDESGAWLWRPGSAFNFPPQSDAV